MHSNDMHDFLMQNYKAQKILSKDKKVKSESKKKETQKTMHQIGKNMQRIICLHMQYEHKQ